MNDKIQHHELIAEWLDDRHGRALMLTQPDGSGCNEAATILLSPWQLREVAEKFDPDGTSNLQAARTIATLKRRMLVMEKRIAHLADYLRTCSDTEHANLDYEIDYACSTAEIAAEFVADIGGVPRASTTSTADWSNAEPTKPEPLPPQAPDLFTTITTEQP